MNTKKFILAGIAVFIVNEVLGYIIHVGILSSAYEATASLWRPEAEMNSMMWMMWLGDLIFSFIFVYIFTRGYENKGIGEGFRYGLLIGFLMSLPMSFGMYVSMPIPGSLAVQWFIYGVINMCILGIVASVVYKPTGN